MKKDKDIIIRLDSELKVSAKKKAKSKGLSLSSFVRMLIIKAVENATD